MTTSDRNARLHEYYRANGIPIPQPSPETRRRTRQLLESLREPGDPPLPPLDEEKTSEGRATA